MKRDARADNHRGTIPSKGILDKPFYLAPSEVPLYPLMVSWFPLLQGVGVFGAEVNVGGPKFFDHGLLGFRGCGTGPRTPPCEAKRRSSLRAQVQLGTEQGAGAAARKGGRTAAGCLGVNVSKRHRWWKAGKVSLIRYGWTTMTRGRQCKATA